MYQVIQPNEWVAIKFPSEQTRVIQIIPNTTIVLGKYGSFPANLLVERPFNVTYEVQDRRDGEDFCRLRIVPAAEIHADTLAETIVSSTSPDADADDSSASPVPNVPAADLSALISTTDPSIVAAVAQKAAGTPSGGSARTQTMTLEDIEALKRGGATDAGRDLVAKLLSSHTALDRKTAYSLAKYRLLKVKKYVRRFTVLPLHVSTLAHWFLEEREASRVLDLREEMMALVGCWANAHFSELPMEKKALDEDEEMTNEGEEDKEEVAEEAETENVGGRWLAIDDTGGLLVAALAERMGILCPPLTEYKDASQPGKPDSAEADAQDDTAEAQDTTDAMDVDTGENSTPIPDTNPTPTTEDAQQKAVVRSQKPITHNCATTNTITVLHTNTQPSLNALKYYGFDPTSPPTRPPFHPLTHHLLTLSWLQLLEPDTDPFYNAKPDTATAEELAGWKASRKSTYFRKLRRWKRISHIIDSTRAGGFSGLAVASTMDPASILQHVMPLLAPGAPIAIYTQTIDPLAQLADYFSTARRTAWTSNPPAEAVGKTAEELERWSGTEDFPVNPTLLLGVGVQSSRARRWQVLPGRTHPLMTGRGGFEGYVFTAWKAVPAVGKIQARGKYKRRKLDDDAKTEAKE